MMCEFDLDLRYLQDFRFVPGALSPWVQPRSRFERRMASNLRPGLVLVLDPGTAARVLGGAALAATGEVVTADLHLEHGRVRIEVVSRGRQVPPICADDAGNFLPALRWYEQSGERSLRAAVMGPSFFWLPSDGTREAV